MAPQTRTGPITIGPSTQITLKPVPKPMCSPTKIKKVLALAKRGLEPKEGDDFEFIDCSLTLTREDVLKGRSPNVSSLRAQARLALRWIATAQPS